MALEAEDDSVWNHTTDVAKPTAYLAVITHWYVPYLAFSDFHDLPHALAHNPMIDNKHKFNEQTVYI